MSWFAPRELGRIETTYTSELGTFVWAWILRADGGVLYRLSHVDGRRERNPWRSVCRLTASELRAIGAGRGSATEWLSHMAREYGHYPAGDHMTGS